MGSTRTAVTAMVVPLAMAACTEPSEAVSRRVVRDSAGIEIVENGSPEWTEETAWRLTSDPLVVLHASDGSEENQLLDPASISVDSEGRIIVADGYQAGWDAILLYDRQGRFLRKVGRSGEGPGEFGQLWWASAYRGDSIVGFDMVGDMVSVFNPDGEFVRQVRTPAVRTDPPPRGTYRFTAGMDAAFANGDFLAYPSGTMDISGGVGPAWHRHLLLRVRPDGTSWDTLGVFEISQQYWNGTRQEPLWFAPFAVSAVSGDDLYFGTGESYEIRRYDRDGDLVRLIRRPHTPTPVDEVYRELLRQWYLDLVAGSPEGSEELLERARRDLEDDRFAEAIPPYSSILVDRDGYLWVSQFRWFGGNARSPIQEPTAWSVFDTAGVWLGDVEVPAGLIVHAVTDDRVLGFVVDEFDVKEVHVYGLERPGL